MDNRSRHDLQLLIDKKWDPVRGVGKTLGRVRAICTTIFLISIVFSSCIPVLPGAYYIAAIPLLACTVQPTIVAHRTKSRAKNQGWFLCPWCRYTLAGLSDAGNCPECGNPYEKRACTTLYESAYRAYSPDPKVLKSRESLAWRRMIELRDGITHSSPPDDSHPSPAS